MDTVISIPDDVVKIGDRVMTPGGAGTVMILEGGSVIHTIWVDMDHADSNYYWMRFSNDHHDNENLKTVNRYPTDKVTPLKLEEE